MVDAEEEVQGEGGDHGGKELDREKEVNVKGGTIRRAHNATLRWREKKKKKKKVTL